VVKTVVNLRRDLLKQLVEKVSTKSRLLQRTAEESWNDEFMKEQHHLDCPIAMIKLSTDKKGLDILSFDIGGASELEHI